MKLTSEQKAILGSKGDIKINAIAGSGKTTTVIEYAKTRNANSRILYLAFNKSVKLEAIQKFKDRGLTNVRVETAHSLAFSDIVIGSKYKIKLGDYKTHEIVEILGIEPGTQSLTEYILANHVNKFAAYFCNSSCARVQELNYLDIITDSNAQKFVQNFYYQIVKQTRFFLAKMDAGEIEITHDFYLKKFQLRFPRLPYDYILFDEGQDASPAMLDVFLRQKCTRVIVGDTHQQIYGWRFAVNSLEKVNYQVFSLSTSFRFGADIAKLARSILDWKKHTSGIPNIRIEGTGKSKLKKSHAVLARTNLALLLKAIEHIEGQGHKKNLYFEGNFNSYTYANEGASLYDVLNLYNGKRKLIRDKLIKQMKNIEELEKYIEQTEDKELSMMVEIVKKYEHRIPSIIKSIKDNHIENNDRTKADIIYSTVHKCKGMEYDIVELANDFITEEKLKRTINGENPFDSAKLNEEINLLYVAITRTKYKLRIPEDIIPIDFPPSLHIEIQKSVSEPVSGNTSYPRAENVLSELKFGRFESSNKRTKPRKANQPWTTEMDDELTELYCNDSDILDMARKLGRSGYAIRLRIKKLDLMNIYR